MNQDTPSSSVGLWIGADPGISGGLVALDAGGAYLSHLLMPVVGFGTKRKRVDTQEIRAWVNETSLAAFRTHEAMLNGRTVWAIERVASMPTDGVVQAFRFGAAAGAIFASADWCGDRIEEISPKSWQRAFLRGYAKGNREEIKASAALAASNRWPKLRPALKVKKNWGLADAAFVAETARVLSHAAQPKAGEAGRG